MTSRAVDEAGFVTNDISARAGIVAVEDAGTEPIDPEVLEQLAEFAEFSLAALALHPHDELSIRIVDEVEMSDLHVQWMNEPGPTDVLSFPMDELRPIRSSADRDPGMLGDIVLCPAFACRQLEQEVGSAPNAAALHDRMLLLLVHGILHLIGHDHGTPAEYDAMFGLQDTVLGDWRQARRGGRS